MDERDFVLEVRCNEPEGEVVRRVRIPELTVQRLRHYYDKLSQFDVLFNDEFPRDPVGFAELFIAGGLENLRPRGLIFEVDDVGILWTTDLGRDSCQVHFTFWDRRLRGRQQLLKEMIRYAFEMYDIARMEVRVGLHAKPMLYFVEKLGFVKEGRLRQETKYKGELFDTNVYSLLQHEVLNGSDTDST